MKCSVFNDMSAEVRESMHISHNLQSAKFFSQNPILWNKVIKFIMVSLKYWNDDL